MVELRAGGPIAKLFGVTAGDARTAFAVAFYVTAAAAAPMAEQPT